MGAVPTKDGSVQPMCSDCGIALCWTIDWSEYEDYQGFWDEWCCEDCNPNCWGSYKKYKEAMDKGFKVVVAGSRGFNNYELLKIKLDSILANKKQVVIVSGTAKGSDELGERYAVEKGYPIKPFPANWAKHGKKAGYLRNREMAEYADAVVVFWDGISPGSKHMIDITQELKKPLRVVLYQPGQV